MKKAFVSILLVLALVFTSFAFVACNDKGDKDEQTKTYSNDEKIAVAMTTAATLYSGGASGSAEDSSSSGLTLSGSVSLPIPTDKLEEVIINALDSADNIIRENGITVTKTTSDKSDYAVKLFIRTTDSNGTTTDSYIYYNATKTVDNTDVAVTDINDETVTTYKLNGLFVAGDTELEFSTSMRIDNERPVFVLNIDLTILEIEATVDAKDGLLDMNFEVSVANVVAIAANIKLGVISDNKYGANVVLTGSILGFNLTTDLELSADTANSKISIDGTITLAPKVLTDDEYVLAINGTAAKNADTGAFELSATAALQTNSAE